MKYAILFSPLVVASEKSHSRLLPSTAVRRRKKATRRLLEDASTLQSVEEHHWQSLIFLPDAPYHDSASTGLGCHGVPPQCIKVRVFRPTLYPDQDERLLVPSC